MTKAHTSTEMSKGQTDNTNNAIKSSITERLQTNLGRSVGVTTTTRETYVRITCKFPMSIRGSYQTICFPLTNVKWHSVTWPYTMGIPYWSDFVPNSTFYRILSGFHRTFATDVACRTCRYFSGLCSSNIPRYFLDFAMIMHLCRIFASAAGQNLIFMILVTTKLV